MIIDGDHKIGQHGKVVLLHEKPRHTKMVGIKTREESYKVAINVSSDTANTAADIKRKHWRKRLRNCENDTPFESLLHIYEVNVAKNGKDARPYRPCIFGKSVLPREMVIVMDKQCQNQLGGYLQMWLALQRRYHWESRGTSLKQLTSAVDFLW